MVHSQCTISSIVFWYLAKFSQEMGRTSSGPCMYVWMSSPNLQSMLSCVWDFECLYGFPFYKVSVLPLFLILMLLFFLYTDFFYIEINMVEILTAEILTIYYDKLLISGRILWYIQENVIQLFCYIYRKNLYLIIWYISRKPLILFYFDIYRKPLFCDMHVSISKASQYTTFLWISVFLS
jgi:hypothetical protein